MSSSRLSFLQLVRDTKKVLEKLPKEKAIFVPLHEEKHFSSPKKKENVSSSFATSLSKDTLPKIPSEKKEMIAPNTPKEPIKEKIISPPNEKDNSFKDLFQLLKKIAPDYALSSSLPDDTTATHAAKLWKYQNSSFPLGVVFFQDEISEKQFLRNLAKAIDLYLTPCRLIDGSFLEKESEWSSFFSSKDLQWVLIPERMKSLNFFQNNTAFTWNEEKKKSYFGTVEIVWIKDFSLYALQPKNKAILWEVLKEKISSSDKVSYNAQ